MVKKFQVWLSENGLDTRNDARNCDRSWTWGSTNTMGHSTCGWKWYEFTANYNAGIFNINKNLCVVKRHKKCNQDGWKYVHVPNKNRSLKRADRCALCIKFVFISPLSPTYHIKKSFLVGQSWWPSTRYSITWRCNCKNSGIWCTRRAKYWCSNAIPIGVLTYPSCRYAWQQIDRFIKYAKWYTEIPKPISRTTISVGYQFAAIWFQWGGQFAATITISSD